MSEISLQAYIQYVEDGLARDAIWEALTHCWNALLRRNPGWMDVPALK